MLAATKPRRSAFGYLNQRHSPQIHFIESNEEPSPKKHGVKKTNKQTRMRSVTQF